MDALFITILLGEKLRPLAVPRSARQRIGLFLGEIMICHNTRIRVRLFKFSRSSRGAAVIGRWTFTTRDFTIAEVWVRVVLLSVEITRDELLRTFPISVKPVL
jgi:hypothetical protein